MKTNIRTFSSKKLVLGLVTTAIGISTIALVSENAHASTSTVKSQTVTKTTKPAPVTTKPSTTVKTVKPVMVKTSTTKATTNVTTKKPQAIVKPIAQKAPVTKKSVSVKKPVSKAISTTTIKAPVASKTLSTTVKKSNTTTKAPTSTTIKKPSSTIKTSAISTKTPTKTQTTSIKTPSKSTMTQTPPKTSSTSMLSSTKPSTSSKVPTTSAPVQPSTITKAPVKTNEELQNIATPKLENTNTQGMTLQSQEAVKPTTETGTNTQNTTRKQDYYKSMTELYNDTKEGIDWKKDTRDVGKSVLIVAPHGGNIEQGTSELTKLVANNGDFDYFSFEAIRPSNNTQLHVTSTNYDDATLHDMIQDRTATISIHGAQGEEQLVYLGGYQSPLRDAIQSQLERKGFVVKIPPEYLGGLSNANFINKVEESTGVQLELTTALRKAFFKDGDASTASRKKIENWTTTMYDFAEALNGAIKQIYPEN
ncbi:poly-gamma-glutamate hydrolase family protein [Staphylococcus cohnii]|uniref:poly-gamma-glutamate hydrolase family protein n=1 Tax=Staphylococcus cohnii TaxID=29382 RepID=UPI00374F1E65